MLPTAASQVDRAPSATPPFGRHAFGRLLLLGGSCILGRWLYRVLLTESAPVEHLLVDRRLELEREHDAVPIAVVRHRVPAEEPTSSPCPALLASVRTCRHRVVSARSEAFDTTQFGASEAGLQQSENAELGGGEGGACL